jgi:hypothetical protein
MKGHLAKSSTETVAFLREFRTEGEAIEKLFS